MTRDSQDLDTVFRNSFRSNLLLVLVVLFLSMGALLSVYIFDRIANAERSAQAHLKQNEGYLLGLILHENEEALNLFIQESNRTLKPLRFHFAKIAKAGHGDTRTFPLKIGAQNFGFIYIDFYFSDVVPTEIVLLYLFFAAIIFLTSFRFYRLTQSFFRQSLIEPLTKMSEILARSSVLTDMERVADVQSSVVEVQRIRGHILASSKELQTREKELRDAKISQALNRIAAQVSHDIRSPLGALRMITSELTQIPPDAYSLILQSVNKIQSIADEMLQSQKTELSHENKNKKEILYVPYALERLLSEKSWEFKERKNLELILDLQHSALGAYAQFQFIEGQRIFSNLINNALEAIPCEKPGRISVRVETLATEVCVRVTDNGRGMSSQLIAKIGERGFSFGKNNGSSGSGLGLYSSRVLLAEWGGRLEVSSQEDQGTEVRVVLPLDQPFRAPTALDWKKLKNVVVVDDSRDILDFWTRKARENHCDLQTFSKPGAFLTAFEKGKIPNSKGETYFIFDFNFESESLTGVELIRRCFLQDEALLVSAAYHTLFRQRDLCVFPKNLEPLLWGNLWIQYLGASKPSETAVFPGTVLKITTTPKLERPLNKDRARPHAE